MKTHFIYFLFVFIFAFAGQGAAQMITVSGFVNNLDTGKPKKNTAVLETISMVGTITNNDGYFRLLLKPGQKIIEFSSPGYMTHTSSFILASDTTFTVDLIPLVSQSLAAGQAEFRLVEPVLQDSAERAAGKH